MAVEAGDAPRIAKIRALKKSRDGAADPDPKKTLEQRLQELEAGPPAKAR
jgi:hypothetical protein